MRILKAIIGGIAGMIIEAIPLLVCVLIAMYILQST